MKILVLILFFPVVLAAQTWDESRIFVFKGEVVDSKCSLGAMTPAAGKSHKTCAIRCIKNGIPPLLKVEYNGGYRYYLLVGQDKNSANELVLPFIGDPVEVRGSVIRDANMTMIVIDAIRKL